METLNQLGRFISRVASDERLKPTHISLYVALRHTWITNRFQQCYHVSRKQLMMLSRIQSKTTYHKTISELINMSYIRYRPSYHPMEGSKVRLLGGTVLKKGDGPKLNNDLAAKEAKGGLM